MIENPRLRSAGTTFTWAMVILVITVGFFWTAYVTEVPWMERMADDGTGTLIATALMAVPVLVVLGAVMHVRFPGQRPAAALGLLASLPVFGALYYVAYNYTVCSIPGC
ncbi:hypothetical protein [Actinoplanes sp. NPDC051851]|uniref:hypothetical protein n=1 Tax=Actinoplanes sp. NPDC051851 TaxID=3154753 RepID=UPI0034129E05